MSIIVRSGTWPRSTGSPRRRNPRNIKFDGAMWSVAHNFLAIALSRIDMRQLIADAVAFKLNLAMEHEDEEVDKMWNAIGRPCLNITSKYAMRIR